MSLIRPVVLCGGSGTRLWPLSRRLEPKQFQKLNSDRSLFQETLARFDGPEFGRATVLVNSVQEPRVEFDLHEMHHPAGLPTILIEPAMRSTAPAIAAAAIALANEDPDAVMLVVPSDHRIGRHDLMIEAYRTALPFVEQGGIALFGIRPNAPEIGFGYIEADLSTKGSVLDVLSFIEKPALDVATALVAGGKHTWNSGIFMFRALTILGELSHRTPDVLNAVTSSIREGRHDGNRLHLSPAFAEAPEISIDHAVMEHSARLGVVPVSPEWNDLGSFEALWEVGERDDDNNVVKGSALLRDVQNSYVNAARRLVCVVGVSDVVVVDTDDVLLVTTRAHSQDVKFVAQHLAKIGNPAADRHVLRQELTGSRRLIDEGDGYVIERLEILPGASLRFSATSAAKSERLQMLTGEVIIEGSGPARTLCAGDTVEIGHGDDVTASNPTGETASLLLSVTRRRQGAPYSTQADRQSRQDPDIRKVG